MRAPPSAARGGLALALATVLGLASCRAPAPGGRPALSPTRGIVLISIDALGARHLGAYGARSGASPFFDALARRGILFEQVAVQYPSTLSSHMSLFTGLYPGEHGVYPPSVVLPDEVPTVPELFRAAGFRTAGHTEGGYMAGGFGFARGFEHFTDTAHAAETDVERTFGRGLDFLRRLGPEERFFLFLHTYAVHDPYDPPAGYLERLSNGDAAAAAPEVPPTGPEIKRLNAAGRPPDPDLARAFARLYAASVRYVDHVLEGFVKELEAAGLLDQTTLIVTSDHGEEFAEHGRLGHTQLYPEVLFVPLLVVHPEVEEGIRVARLVEILDLAPTLIELGGLETPPRFSGESLLPLPAAAAERSGTAYAELLIAGRLERTLLAQQRRSTYQLLTSQPIPDPEGSWIGRQAGLDLSEPELELSVRAFHRPRRLEVRTGGRTLAALTVGTDWEEHRIPLPAPAARRRLELLADGCESPAALGLGDDPRCLSLQVSRPPLWRTELYDLGDDPLARVERGGHLPEVHRRLARRLAGMRFTPVAEARSGELTEETLETLRALGYLD